MAELSPQQLLELAALVRSTCLDVAGQRFEQAAFDGLCAEGAWEAAVDAALSLDLAALLAAWLPAAES